MPQQTAKPTHLVSQSPAYVRMIGNPPPVMTPAPLQNHNDQSKPRSDTLSPGPTRTAKRKPPPRKSPYPSSKPTQIKPSSPTPPKPELCILLGCEDPTPHNHPDSEVEAKIGWYPRARQSQGTALSPTNEARLQKHLDARFPIRPFAYTTTRSNLAHRRGSSILDILDPVGIADLRAELPEVGDQAGSSQDGELIRRPHDMDRSLASLHPPLRKLHWLHPQEADPDTADHWPCDEDLGCDINLPHDHTSKEVVGKLSQTRTARQSTHSQLELTPISNAIVRPQQPSTGLPDMRWKPCSMLDAYGTNSTDALLDALPALPSADDDESRAVAVVTKQAFPPLEGGPEQYRFETRHLASAQQKPGGVSSMQAHDDERAVTSEGDVGAAVEQLEALSIRVDGDRKGGEKEDPLRAWFVRCGYLEE